MFIAKVTSELVTGFPFNVSFIKIGTTVADVLVLLIGVGLSSFAMISGTTLFTVIVTKAVSQFGVGVLLLQIVYSKLSGPT